MMATEATVEKAVDVSVNDPSLTESSPTTADPEIGSKPATSKVGPVDDLDNKQITDIVDELVNSAEASVSGGSDTEAAKSRSIDDKAHGRNSSTANKPKSFKSVSVNRTFLAKGATPNPTSRPESAAGSASSTPAPSNPASSASKLKLVAKSGTSLGGSVKTLSSNGKPAGAPDGNSVWNRNRPTPTPEPKKLSDEELLSHGIHIADRLRPEDVNKRQDNWADIEDDEEWAPEAITWTDGTQIALPQADEIATSPAPAPATLEKQPEAPPKSRSPVPPSGANAIPPPATRSDLPGSRKGLVLKGAPEKPTLVAKPPPPPGPVKSPWQTLPPVDKVSPVVMDLPHGQGPHGYRGPPPPLEALQMRNAPHAAKEIAADDFSRAPYREASNVNRELYNSHSGRYEPVHDRRGSRNEGYGRQPAVLQRPGPHDQQGPAEPSAAFQTSRATPYEAPYGRRRGSSNVSGGSGAMAHRLGKPNDMPPPIDVIQARSGSIAGGTESPASTRTFSPANNQHPTPRSQHSQPWQPRPSPGQAHATPHQPAAPNEQSPSQPASIEHDIEMQKKIMREKRELAMKRRLEEEAREEAARKERIRLKLEAMGPAPERKSAKKDEHRDEAKPTQIAQRTEIPAALASKPTALQEAAPLNPSASHSPPQPRPVTSSKEPKMLLDQATTPPSTGDSTSRAHAVPPVQSKASWPGSPQGPLWGGAPRGNVWAAPGNDRTLGNGTFNADLGHLPDPHPPMPGISHRPGPIGPPRSQQDPPVRPDGPANRLAPIGPPRSRDQQSHAANNPWRNYNAAEEDRVLMKVKQAENESRMKQLAEKGLDVDATQPAMADTWKSVRVDGDGQRFKDTVQGRIFEDGQSAVPWNPSAGPPSLHDRSVPDHVDITSQDIRQQPGPHALRDNYGRNPVVGPPGAIGSGPVTRSRFFPAPRDARHDDTTAHQQMRTKSPTPPPPTMEDHPAYEGNPGRPHVSLPPHRPVVKLPPSAMVTPTPKPSAPISFAAAAAAPIPAKPQAPQQTNGRPPSQGTYGVSQRPHEIASQENWQDKINSLIGKKSIMAPRTFGVDSFSRHPIDHGHASHPSATVSLPSLSSTCSTVSDSNPCTTKEMAEECFEEQEMGSLPTVHLPMDAPEALWHSSEIDWEQLTPKFRVQSTNAEPLRFSPDYHSGKTVIRISAPGMAETKNVVSSIAVASSLHGSRTRSNPRRSGPRGGGRHASRGGSRANRETSNDHSSSQTSGPSGRPGSNRNGRGGFRSRSENWNRGASSASAAQS